MVKGQGQIRMSSTSTLMLATMSIIGIAALLACHGPGNSDSGSSAES